MIEFDGTSNVGITAGCLHDLAQNGDTEVLESHREDDTEIKLGVTALELSRLHGS